MVSMYLLIPLSLMLFVVGIWAVRYAVKSNQFEDLDNAAQRVILDDRQERRQALKAGYQPTAHNNKNKASNADPHTTDNDSIIDSGSVDSGNIADDNNTDNNAPNDNTTGKNKV